MVGTAIDRKHGGFDEADAQDAKAGCQSRIKLTLPRCPC
jgi:hypothetical protein